MFSARQISRIILTSLAIELLAIGVVFAAPDASALFKTKCSSCHTFGKGDRVGPDLKGVTARHERAWLIKWIRSSEALLRSGDPEGNALFRKYGRQRMPDHDLSDAQIGSLLDYIDHGGPLTDEPRLRLATDATSLEIRQGSNLFFGKTHFTSGAVACVYCHSLSKETRLGGSLAGDLSKAYSRYLDWPLDQKLRSRCLPGGSDPNATRVNQAESLAIRAFLRSVSDSSTDVGRQGIRTAAER